MRCIISQIYLIKYSTCYGEVRCPSSGVSQHCTHAKGICYASSVGWLLASSGPDYASFIRIRHDTRSSECQISKGQFLSLLVPSKCDKRFSSEREILTSVVNITTDRQHLNIIKTG